MELIKNYKEGKLTTADIRTLNNTIICLMILITTTSIVWSICIHTISGDLYNGFLGAKLKFHERDFLTMDNKTKQMYYEDLESILAKTYTNKTNSKDIIAMRQSSDAQESFTKKSRKLVAHVIRISSAADDESDVIKEEVDEDPISGAETMLYDPEVDRQFLSKMAIDPDQTVWSQSPAVQFVYIFSYMSEIIAIIWAAMCLVFQSGVKKYRGLPEPWRIVVPSILMFTVMTVGNLVYVILANQFIKEFCIDLRESLTNPSAISCGNAFNLLRPVIIKHVLNHSAYLSLYKISYTFSLILWSMALLVMVFRYLLAIDFEVVEIEPPKHIEEFIEVPLNSPKHQPANLLKINESAKSEDDFQSAKTHLSEAITPLLDSKNQQHF